MNRSTKLTISIILDLFGMCSYLFPFIGELSDVIFAPLQAWWIMHAYNSKKGAILGFVEEILPFSDFIPSCTIAHLVATRKK